MLESAYRWIERAIDIVKVIAIVLILTKTMYTLVLDLFMTTNKFNRAILIYFVSLNPRKEQRMLIGQIDWISSSIS